jgi:uncharacterized membrane protein
MIPFYVMLAGILIARLLGVVWPALEDWRTAARVGLAIMFVFTGLAHFSSTRDDLVRMVPPQFPHPSALVILIGVAELAGAVGLAFRRTVTNSTSRLIRRTYRSA